MNAFCNLCQLPCSDSIIQENSNTFCCHGCRAVYAILSSKGILENYQKHPIFEQAVKCGLISNPILHQNHSHMPYPEREFEKLYLEINDMWCPSCAEIIRWILAKEKGIVSCSVDYTTDLSVIQYLPRFISKEKIINLIQELGYHSQPMQDVQNPPVNSYLKLRFIIAAFCSLNLMMFATPLYASFLTEDPQGLGNLFSWISFFTVLPVLSYSAIPLYKRAWTSFSVGKITMEILAVLGISSAFLLSTLNLIQGGNQVYFETLSVIITFMLLGKMIESKAKFSSKNALFRILRSLPKKGRKLFSDNSESFVPIKEILLGDQIVVLTGEKIPLDSIVVEGEGTCDESLLTGESKPIFKKSGDQVLSGSVLQQGKLFCLVNKEPDHSTLNKIVHIVEQEITHKTEHYRLADLISQWFVPLILLLALLTFGVCLFFEINDSGLTPAQTAFYRTLAILLISCPCALGIAAPIAESRIIHALAEAGAIVRNRSVLNLLGKESTWIFDKTGTLTKGDFTLIMGMDKVPKKWLPILKGLTSSSNHPASKTIHAHLDITAESPKNFKEYPGKGIIAEFSLGQFFLGSQQFAQENESYQAEYNQDLYQKYTVCWFGKHDDICFPITLGDTLRADAVQAVNGLKGLNLWVLSGDSPQITAHFAALCGIQNWKGSCTPNDKKNIVRNLKEAGNIVAMVGDGINDAPALASANIGISVVNASDISINASDILITNGNLLTLPQIRLVASKGRTIVLQNLFWAFAYNICGLAFAAFGLLSPLVAAAAMITSSLFVIFNAKRI